MSEIELLEERALTYRFFSNVFLVLPNEEFVRQMLAYPQDDDSEGGRLVAAWAKENADADINALVTAVSVDRTRLFRGLTADGPIPPYESLFLGSPVDHTPTMRSVAGSFRAIGFEQTGGVHDAPDYLGNEMAFMDRVVSEELSALGAGDTETAGQAHEIGVQFLRTHLGCWAGRYSREMEAKAETDLYRGLALVLRAFIEDEMAAVK